MKRVTQTTFGEGEGNCMQAAVASVVEVEWVDLFCALGPAARR
jgi:hypothetical protein